MFDVVRVEPRTRDWKHDSIMPRRSVGGSYFTALRVQPSLSEQCNIEDETEQEQGCCYVGVPREQAQSAILLYTGKERLRSPSPSGEV